MKKSARDLYSSAVADRLKARTRIEHQPGRVTVELCQHGDFQRALRFRIAGQRRQRVPAIEPDIVVPMRVVGLGCGAASGSDRGYPPCRTGRSTCCHRCLPMYKGPSWWKISSAHASRPIPWKMASVCTPISVRYCAIARLTSDPPAPVVRRAFRSSEKRTPSSPRG